MRGSVCVVGGWSLANNKKTNGILYTDKNKNQSLSMKNIVYMFIYSNHHGNVLLMLSYINT